MMIQRLAVLLILIFAVSCSKNTKESEATPEEPTKEDAKKEDGKEKPSDDNAEVPGADIYPGFQFGLVKPENRVKFVKFATAELCPCEKNGAISLHECLQKTDGRCKVAMQVAEMGAMMYEAGFSETDVADKVTEFIDSTKKTHEFDLSDRPFKGSEKAPVTIVEFADFQCPHCKETSYLLDDLSKANKDKFKLVYKHFPLSANNFSPVASKAAVAAHRQGKFWEMHDLLFKHQKELSAEKLLEFGQRIGLNMQKFKTDMDDPTVAGMVAADRAEGEKARLTGTPTLYINGKLYLGDLTKDAILKAVTDAGTTTK